MKKLTEQKFMVVILSGILDVAEKCILFYMHKGNKNSN